MSTFKLNYIKLSKTFKMVKKSDVKIIKTAKNSGMCKSDCLRLIKFSKTLKTSVVMVRTFNFQKICDCICNKINKIIKIFESVENEKNLEVFCQH